jgi:hypothetical protein
VQAVVQQRIKMHDKKNQGTFRLGRGHAMKQGFTHPLEVQKSAKISDCRLVLVLVLVVPSQSMSLRRKARYLMPLFL